MDKKIYIVLLAFATLTSCGTQLYEEDLTINNNTVEENIKNVTFSIGKTVSDTESVTGETRLSTKLEERCTNLQYWIFDNDYKKVIDSGSQNTSTTNFGTFSAQLPYGTYHVVAVGHQQNSDFELDTEDMMIKLGKSDTRFYDTYFCNGTCTVAKEITGTSLTLKRNMCLLYIKHSEATTNIDSLKISLSAYGNIFSAKNGVTESSPTKSTISYTIELKKEYENLNMTIYFPLPAFNEEFNTVALKITPIDKNGENYDTVSFNNIPAKIGRKITYVGKLWENKDASFTIDVSDQDWIQDIENKTY